MKCSLSDVELVSVPVLEFEANELQHVLHVSGLRPGIGEELGGPEDGLVLDVLGLGSVEHQHLEGKEME